MFNVNNKDTGMTPLASFWCLCCVVNFEHISHLVLVFLLLIQKVGRSRFSQQMGTQSICNRYPTQSICTVPTPFLILKMRKFEDIFWDYR